MTARTALVTGGASGIGREICKALAADGRRVAVADIQSDAAAETAQMITEAGGITANPIRLRRRKARLLSIMWSPAG